MTTLSGLPANSVVRDILVAAHQDLPSVIQLTRELVTIPSRGGIDPYEPILTHLRTWLREHDVDARTLRGESGEPVGLVAEVHGAKPGPRWVLDTCLDTAPFGDESAWTHPPTSAHIADGWMWGRGTADSKSGAAIFCHIAARVATVADRLTGTLVLLFDVDEHTGGFAGAERYFEGPDAPDDVAGVMIGYPGMDKLVIGGRGVHRARLDVRGVSSHSGGRASTPDAILKAADLIARLGATDLPDRVSPGFGLAPKLTVTAISGGQGFSVTPDLCRVNVDIRTTPDFDDDAAAALIKQIVTQIDDGWPQTPATEIILDTRWPPYSLPDTSVLRSAILDAAHDIDIQVDPKIAGPSNIGNYLAGLNIAATAGFGVVHIGLHATDERARLDTIPAVQAIYHRAVLTLLQAPSR